VADAPRAAAAIASAVCTVAGTAAVLVAVVAGPGPGLTGYVSEAGVAASPYAWAYRLGIFGLAAALLLLAAVLPAALRLAAVLLAASGACTVLSGAVSCTDGCPLPPFEQTTVADLVHGGASIAGVAGAVFAMLALAASRAAPRPLRRLSATAATVALPLSGAAGLALLAVGRGTVVALVERLLLADVALWMLTAAVATGWQHSRDRRSWPDGRARAAVRRVR
jgi:Protein of unknown function (DUF998)